VVQRGPVVMRAVEAGEVCWEGEIAVDAAWLGSLRKGDVVRCVDTRGRTRAMLVERVLRAGRMGAQRVIATLDRTTYIGTGTVLRIGDGGRTSRTTVVGEMAAVEQAIVVRVGEVLRIDVRGGIGRLATARTPATLSCTLPEALAKAKAGEMVWIDDGRVGARIRRVRHDFVEAVVTHAPADGAKIRADKGINLPDTEIALAGLSPADVEALPMIAAHADIVAMSFVRSPADIADLRGRLAALGGKSVGVVLKIETRQAFDALPSLLLEALQAPAAEVMIARGDLAVEVGYERLAEVQEEILWLCEAAHVPVIWATQVLETMAKTGRPSRAEVSDAAMGERAECVMLNKGPHIVETVRFLDDLMRRMQQHQSKKRATMRALGVARRFGGGKA
jgi:pyruvate kinase